MVRQVGNAGASSLADFLRCTQCEEVFSVEKLPVSIDCGHVMCEPCISSTYCCPNDRTMVSHEAREYPLNTWILSILGINADASGRRSLAGQLKGSPNESHATTIDQALADLASYFRYDPTDCEPLSADHLSTSVGRKLLQLLGAQLASIDGRHRGMQMIRLTVDRVVHDLIASLQPSSHLSTHLWSAVRSRGCQFLGPAMQEDVLKLVLLTLSKGELIARKTLVMYIVQTLSEDYPHVSKTCVGHVVQLLYRASCFNVIKRDGESSLMQLKEEFRNYDALRGEHDAQIVQIAFEAGLRISPEQWSSLLYGDPSHRAHMQSVADRLSSPQSLSSAVLELKGILDRNGGSEYLDDILTSLSTITTLDYSTEDIKWETLMSAALCMRCIIQTYAAFHRRKSSATDGRTTKPEQVGGQFTGQRLYKTRLCRDVIAGRSCPRGDRCTYAHKQEELRSYNSQNKLGSEPFAPSAPPGYAPSVAAEHSFTTIPSGATAQTTPTNGIMMSPPPTMQPEMTAANPAGMAPPPNQAYIVEQNVDGSAQMVPVFPVMFHPAQTPAPPGTVTIAVVPNQTMRVNSALEQTPFYMVPPSEPIVRNPIVMPPAMMAAGFAAMHPMAGQAMPDMFGSTMYPLPVNGIDMAMMPQNTCCPEPAQTFMHVNQIVTKDREGWVDGSARQANHVELDGMKRRRNSSTPRSPDWEQFFDGRQLNMKREEIVSRLEKMRSRTTSRPDDDDDVDSHVSYTVASSVLYDDKDNTAFVGPSNIELPPLPVPPLTSSLTDTLPKLSSGEKPKIFATVRTVCPTTMFRSQSSAPATVQADSTVMNVKDMLDQPLVSSAVQAKNLSPQASYDMVDPCHMTELLPTVIKPLAFPSRDPQNLVSSTLDRIVNVRERMNDVEMSGGITSAVEKAQLEVELKIVNRQIASLDENTKESCLRKELKAVDEKIEQLSL